MPIAVENKAKLVVLTGNPNCGKTTVFNALTGLRAKVGNYAGVTVERKEGRLLGSLKSAPVTVLDLPGTYSLSPQSLDEQIVRDVLFRRLQDVSAPDLVVLVVDASNLERHLYYATQVIELGYPTLLALNMMDVAADNGHEINALELGRLLGVGVVPMVASRGKGVRELRARILERVSAASPAPNPPLFCDLPERFRLELDTVAHELEAAYPERNHQARCEALLMLGDERTLGTNSAEYPASLRQAVAGAWQRLDAAGVPWRSAVIEGRYGRAASIFRAVCTQKGAVEIDYSDQIDRLVTHKIWGILIFFVLMALMFQTIFSLARLPMHALDSGVAYLGALVARLIPPGDLQSLVVDGMIAGVGAVVVFVPQICLLFLFIGLLEDTGYMARAAFLMDRFMSKVGLHGKSFIPMLSSFACAIPGIMATRTIESAKDRLATILVAPLMACSARLPVYTLLIGACIPERRVLGLFRLPGMVLFSMYMLGIVVALGVAWLLKKTLLKGDPPMLIMELPPYKRPVLQALFRHVWDRAKMFLHRAGTVILGFNILIWFLTSYPHHATLEQKYASQRQALAALKVAKVAPELTPSQNGRTPQGVPGVTASNRIATAKSPAEEMAQIDRQEASDRMQHSFAGWMGRALEPVIAPLGMDWKIGIGIIASFAAREIFVSTMSTVYSVDAEDHSEAARHTLQSVLRQQTRPDGSSLFTPLTAVTLMVFYVFALQCVSTVAVVRRETNSWKWPLFQWAYMGLLAWGFAFLTYHGGHWLGFQ